jgi:hypothetical protein
VSAPNVSHVAVCFNNQLIGLFDCMMNLIFVHRATPFRYPLTDHFSSDMCLFYIREFPYSIFDVTNTPTGGSEVEDGWGGT